MKPSLDTTTKAQAKVPGPGAYNPRLKAVEQTSVRAYSLSGRNGSYDFSQGAEKKRVPGPGNYNIKSPSESARGTVFGTAQRLSLDHKAVAEVPGPGTYKATDLVAKTSMPTVV